MPGGLSRLPSLPFGLSYFDVPQGTPAYSKPRLASVSIEIQPGIKRVYAVSESARYGFKYACGKLLAAASVFILNLNVASRITHSVLANRVESL